MSNYILQYKQEDLQKLENTADNILYVIENIFLLINNRGEQDGLLKEIEKTKLEFYNAEFIDIHDTVKKNFFWVNNFYFSFYLCQNI